MANQFKPINELAKEEIQELINACISFDAGNILGPEYRQSEVSLYAAPKFGWRWKSKEEFAREIRALTGAASIPEANKILEKLLTQAPQAPAATRPGKEELEILVEKAEVSAKTHKAAAQKAKEETEQLIEALKRRKKIRVVPKEKIPEVTLSDREKETLHSLGKAAKIDPGRVQKKFKEAIAQSLEKSPEEISTAVPPQTTTMVAVDLVERVMPYGNYKTPQEIPSKLPSMHPASPIAALAILNDAKLKLLIPNEEERRVLAQNAQAVALVLEANHNVNASLAGAVFPGSENIIGVLYGPDQITPFEVAEDQEKEDGIEIDVGETIDQGKNIQNIWQKLATKEVTPEEVAGVTTTFVPTYTPSTVTATATESSALLTKTVPTTFGAIYGFRQGALASIWAKQNVPLLLTPQASTLLTTGGIQSLVATSNIVSSRVLFDVSLGQFSFKVATAKTAAGADLFVAGTKFGERAFGVVAGRTPTAAALGIVSAKAGGLTVKTVASGLLAKVGAFLGTPLGGLVGAAIGFIAGEVIGKLISKISIWVKKHKEDLAILGTILFGGGVILRSIPLMIFGGIFAAPVFWGGVTLAAVAARTSFFFWTLGRTFIITIGTPILVALLVFPVVVALILLIINSGAYLVPPSPYSSLIGADNPYMLVTKTANPSKLNKSSQPQSVTYTVTIKALKSPLTNIKITKTECKVVKKDRSKVFCPSEKPPENIPPIEKGLTVSPASEHTFTFTAEYDSKYRDSLIYDSIEITADTPKQTGITTSGSESVCIGDCPTDCVKVVDSAKPWPGNQKSNTESAVAQLVSGYQGFMAKVCADGKEVNLCYDPSQIDPGYFAFHAHGQCDVYYNEKGVSSSKDALFLTAHELTHHIQKINGLSIAQYLASGGFFELAGRGFCSYKDTAGSVTEAMAEANGLYAAIPRWGGCATNYKSQYPLNYNFAKSFME